MPWPACRVAAAAQPLAGDAPCLSAPPPVQPWRTLPLPAPAGGAAHRCPHPPPRLSASRDLVRCTLSSPSPASPAPLLPPSHDPGLLARERRAAGQQRAGAAARRPLAHPVRAGWWRGSGGMWPGRGGGQCCWWGWRCRLLRACATPGHRLGPGCIHVPPHRQLPFCRPCLLRSIMACSLNCLNAYWFFQARGGPASCGSCGGCVFCCAAWAAPQMHWRSRRCWQLTPALSAIPLRPADGDDRTQGRQAKDQGSVSLPRAARPAPARRLQAACARRALLLALRHVTRATLLVYHARSALPPLSAIPPHFAAAMPNGILYCRHCIDVPACARSDPQRAQAAAELAGRSAAAGAGQPVQQLCGGQQGLGCRRLRRGCCCCSC